jgi:ABC-type spermidine/putrescine transport system permease subunit II
MGVEYYAQVIAPIINAFATLILVLVTAVYVWLTKRIVDESAHQNRP